MLAGPQSPGCPVRATWWHWRWSAPPHSLHWCQTDRPVVAWVLLLILLVDGPTSVKDVYPFFANGKKGRNRTTKPFSAGFEDYPRSGGIIVMLLFHLEVANRLLQVCELQGGPSTPGTPVPFSSCTQPWMLPSPGWRMNKASRVRLPLDKNLLCLLF